MGNAMLNNQELALYCQVLQNNIVKIAFSNKVSDANNLSLYFIHST